MRCPSCKREIPDHAVICDHCKSVVDPSLAGDGDLWDDTEPRSRRAPPAQMDLKRSAQRARKRPTGPVPQMPQMRGRRAPTGPVPQMPKLTDPTPNTTGPLPRPSEAQLRPPHMTGPQSGPPARSPHMTGPQSAPGPDLMTTGPQPGLPTEDPATRARRAGDPQLTGPVHGPLQVPGSQPERTASVFTSAPSDEQIEELAASSPPSASQRAIATQIVDLDPEGQRGTRIVEVSVPAVVKRAQRRRERGEAAEEEEDAGALIDKSMLGLRHFYLRMHRLDRWTVWVLILCFVAAFLPWERERGIGLVAGVEGLGALGAGAALLAFLCVYFRTERRRLSALLITLQVLVAAGIVAVPLYRLIMVGVDEYTQIIAGLYAAAALGVVAVLLTLARLTRLNA